MCHGIKAARTLARTKKVFPVLRLWDWLHVMWLLGSFASAPQMHQTHKKSARSLGHPPEDWVSLIQLPIEVGQRILLGGRCSHPGDKRKCAQIKFLEMRWRLYDELDAKVKVSQTRYSRSNGLAFARATRSITMRASTADVRTNVSNIVGTMESIGFMKRMLLNDTK